jgi:hypothetical protein
MTCFARLLILAIALNLDTPALAGPGPKTPSVLVGFVDIESDAAGRIEGFILAVPIDPWGDTMDFHLQTFTDEHADQLIRLGRRHGMARIKGDSQEIDGKRKLYVKSIEEVKP